MHVFKGTREITIYDLNGNKIKELDSFIYKDTYYLINPSTNISSYSFKVEDDGNIIFFGTKNPQDEANIYIIDANTKIDICVDKEKYNIKDSDIVTAVFTVKYLGDFKFSDINYKETVTTVKDIKWCN